MRRRNMKLVAIPALLIYSLSAVGCYQWEPTPIPPASERLPSNIRVTLTDGRRVELANPTVEADSIKAPRARAIPVSAVQGIEAREASAVGVVGSILFAVGAVAALVALFANEMQGCCSPWGG